MLAKCANPSCSSVFRSLEQGALFRVEPEPRLAPSELKLEYFWLCVSCSAEMTLCLDEDAGIKINAQRDDIRRALDSADTVLMDRRKGAATYQNRHT
jgi:hypothetical protein